MTNAEVEIGQRYFAKASGGVTVVKILHARSLTGGWTAMNHNTGRAIFIRSGQRLRKKVSEEEFREWLMKAH